MHVLDALEWMHPLRAPSQLSWRLGSAQQQLTKYRNLASSDDQVNFANVDKPFLFSAFSCHPNQFGTIIEGDAFPIRQVTDVGRAVDALAPFDGTGYFTSLNQAEWNAYHSFTHGGLMALDAYGNRPNLRPDYAPDRILALLDNAQRMSGMAALGMAWIGLMYEPELTKPIYDAINELGPEIGR